jgi:hypothetical protein
MALTKRERIKLALLNEYFSRAEEPIFNGADDPELNWQERIDSTAFHHIEYAIDFMSRQEERARLLVKQAQP